jgi:phospholipase C
MQPKLHNYCIDKTFELLYNDSKFSVIDTLLDKRISGIKADERIKLMHHGSYIIDRLAIKKLRVHWFGGHYLYPHSHAGYISGFSDAGTKCVQLFNIALKDWEKGKFKKSFINLGGAVHLVQDLCIPFHTTNLALKKHVLFERWMSSHYLETNLKLEKGVYKFKPLRGHYRDAHPFGWVDYNAHNSSLYLPELLYTKTKLEYFNAMNRILPEAVKTSAGFLELFANKAAKLQKR